AAALALQRPAAWRICLVALGVIIFQAMLGMWTVTLLLKPVVVTGHLLGGMTTFALLGYAAVRFAGVGAADDALAGLRRLVILGIVLLACQIALGGWTSSNYAALATRRSRSASASGGRRATITRASSCGAASAWTTKAASSTRARAPRSRW